MPRARPDARSSLLPPSRRPRIARPVPQLSAGALDVLEAALVFVPADRTRAELARLPHASGILSRFDRGDAKPGSHFACRLRNGAGTTLVVALVPREATPFALLELARAAVGTAMQDDPATLGCAAAGLPAALGRKAIEAGIAAALAACFRLPEFKSKPGRRSRLDRVVPFARRGLDPRRAAALSEGTDLVRWLMALPPDRLDPAGFRQVARALARRHGVATRFYGEKELARLGAGAFLAVTRGSSRRDAGILQLRYRPARRRDAAPVALVGKGLCFDTGGTNLKPHSSMLHMHGDMGGSAVALAGLLSLARLGYPGPVDAWLALAENRIGPDAYKPQDVVTALDGTTIQVIHTDAEGRMVLADTLALASRSKPASIVDFATLTGACMQALGNRMSGAFTNRPAWRADIEAAGRESGERVWCMPMDADYDRDIDSKVADVAQCRVDGRGDHIYAARFLSRFVGEEIPWLHVDLSAATREGGLGHVPTDITGFGVRFLASLLLDRELPAAGPAA